MKPYFLVVNKPAGITSHDVVAAIRAVTGVKKVGHTGTLDPFATGVLPIALGGSTRLIQFLDESLKVYDALIRFGTATDTGDPTGQVIREAPLPTQDEAEVRAVLEGFLGPQLQTPPAYSAVKVRGRPLYDYARKGETVEVKARPIHIYHLELQSYDHEHLRVVITCSRGTYARVLADDIATALGSAGHLEELRRDASGPFLLEQSIDFETLAGLVSAEAGLGWHEVLLARRKDSRVPWRPRDDVRQDLLPWLQEPIHALGHLPLLDVDQSTAERILRGGPAPEAPPGVPAGGRFLLVCGADVVGVGEVQERGPAVIRLV
ncbi:MAG: tRNA pseudouridine(55) synthase TruB [Deltaproteobacteria bacterium]|nr:tRNA pseudouridine(55) synthase TruB [Deltaproteobacteria bacterium]